MTSTLSRAFLYKLEYHLIHSNAVLVNDSHSVSLPFVEMVTVVMAWPAVLRVVLRIVGVRFTYSIA